VTNAGIEELLEKLANYSPVLADLNGMTINLYRISDLGDPIEMWSVNVENTPCRGYDYSLRFCKAGHPGRFGSRT